MRGWCVAHGLHLAGMDAADAIAVLYVIVMEAGGQLKMLTELDRRLSDPYWLTDETFGTGPTAEQGQAAMMGMFPGA